MSFPRLTPSASMSSTRNLISHSKVLHVSQGASTSPVGWMQPKSVCRRYPISSVDASGFGMVHSLTYSPQPHICSYLCQGLHNPCVCLVRASDQATGHNPPRQAKKQRLRPGRSKRHYHFFKRTGQSETGTKAANLVEIVKSLSNVKEEIYAALDEWVAFEVEFPKIALGKALRRLKEREQWQRIIQVSKWMWSKGQGKTVGTYGLMLKAYEMDARLEDCKLLWENISMHYGKSMPKSMFVRMLHIYKRQHMPEELVQVFEQMESFKIRPDKDTLELVKEAYRQLGHPEMDQSLTARYPPRWRYLNFKGRSVKVRPRPVSVAGSEEDEIEEEENGSQVT